MVKPIYSNTDTKIIHSVKTVFKPVRTQCGVFSPLYQFTVDGLSFVALSAQTREIRFYAALGCM